MEHFNAGALASFVSAVSLQPLDVVKTRIQEDGQKTICCAAGSQKSSLLRSIKIQYQSEGLMSFWRGTVPTILRNSPGAATYFTLLDFTCRSFESLAIQYPIFRKILFTTWELQEKVFIPSDTNHFLRGSFARGFAGWLFMPITLIKTRLESRNFKEFGILECTRNIYNHEGGFSAYFRGFSATLLRDAPYAGIYLLFYERIKNIFRKTTSLDTKQILSTSQSLFFQHAFAGFSAAFLASFVTHPFDVIKTRMQVYPEKYPKFMNSFCTLAKEEGLRAFLAGIAPRLIRKGLNAAITWALYEQLSLPMRIKEHE